MTKEDMARTLRYMERLREQSYEAGSKRAERRMTAEYGRLARSIEPYLTGKIPYSESRPGDRDIAQGWNA